MGSLNQADTEQRSLFQFVVDGSQTGVCVFDAVWDDAGNAQDFRFAMLNPAGAAMLNRHADELIGTSYRAHFSQAENSGLLGLYRQVLKTGQPIRLLEVPYFADGVQGWFDINITRYQKSVVVTFVDISALKRVQINERKQASFFNQLLHTSPSGVIAYESVRTPATDSEPHKIIDFRAIFFNASYERMFGEGASSIYNNSLRQRFDIDNEDLFPFYASVVETGESFRRERYYARQKKWLLLSGEKLFDGFLLVISDITVQKETELAQHQLADALSEANQELIRSNESLEQFAYVASHDLQEPLRKIQQFGNLLQMRYRESVGDEGQYVERMQSAASRMATLISDLLSYSRVSIRREESQPVALNAVVDEVISDLYVRIAETNAQIHVDALPTVMGDVSQLGQLFLNLIGNALKFQRQDDVPQLAIRSQLVMPADLPPSLRLIRKSDAYHRIDIADNGIGFDDKYLDRIFQVFQRLHGKSQYAGTGIGLAICAKVATNHGGAITATSKPGEGATFSVYLPV